MNPGLVIREISENSDENSLSNLRKKFWEKELGLSLEILPSFTKGLASAPCSMIILNEKASQNLVNISNRVRTEVIEMQFADSLALKDGHWWLYSFLSEALSQLIVQKSPTLNTHRVAYIIGSNIYSMMSAAVAIKMGFENLSFVVENVETMDSKIKHLNKKFFGLQIRVIKDSELTLQPSNGSLLINGLSASDDESLLEDLTYLNFLDKTNSLIIEICFSKQKNEVIQEAEHVQIPFVSSSELWGMRDYIILKSVQPEIELSSQQYLEKWQAFLSLGLVTSAPPQR